MIALAVMLAGGLGAVARFVLDGEIKRLRNTTFPWATLLINVTGSAALGVLAGLVIGGAPAELQTILGTGFCGGYTTFSTASFEVVRLGEERLRPAPFLYAAASVIGSVAACALGLLAATAIT